MGYLSAAGSVPVVIVGLAAGLWVDRLRRRPIMVTTDVARALLLLSIPAAALSGALTTVHLYIVAALMGLLSLFFDVADAAYLPTLVPQEELVEANSRVSASSSIAEIGGQSLGGALVQALTAPFAVALDALSYLVSASYLLRIQKPEPHPRPEHSGEKPLDEIREGLHAVTRHPTLRLLTLCDAGSAFFGSFYGVLYTLFAVRVLHMSPLIVGLGIAVGGAGSLVGALLTPRIVARFGRGRSLVATRIWASMVQCVFLLAGLPVPVAVAGLMAMQFVGDVVWTAYEITATSVRQEAIPGHLLGRASAGLQVLTRGLYPLGAVTAGLVATVWSAGAALAVGYLGLIVSALVLLGPPVRKLA
jgi:predicted MFS family arabinose efflux permease